MTRTRNGLVALTAAILAIPGCAGGNAARGPLASSSVDTTARPDIAGEWVGMWTTPGGTGSAYLSIERSRPMSASVSIPSESCTARWTEVSRIGTTITIDADVTAGSCVDNRWILTVTDTLIIGVDSKGRPGDIRLSRQ